jgi:hypothetical protein
MDCPRSFPLLLCALPLLACSGIHSIARDGVASRTLPELLADVAQQKEAYRFPARGLIVRVPAGSRLPIRVTLDTPFVTVEPAASSVRFDRDVYLFLRGHDLALSPDGVRWADVRRPGALKRLFGVGRGSFEVGAGIVKDQGAIVQATLRLDQRR